MAGKSNKKSERSSTADSSRSSFQIVPWKEVHLPAIFQIELNSFPQPWSLLSFYDLFCHPRTFGFVGLSNQSILGYILILLIPDEMEILNVAVEKGFQKKGLGEALMHAAHELGRKSKCVHSFLEVRESNAKAFRMYKKLGYTELSRRMRYYSDTKEDALIMKKKL